MEVLVCGGCWCGVLGVGGGLVQSECMAVWMCEVAIAALGNSSGTSSLWSLPLLQESMYSVEGVKSFCAAHMRLHGLTPKRRLCQQSGCTKQAKTAANGTFAYCKAHMLVHGLQPQTTCKRCQVCVLCVCWMCAGCVLGGWPLHPGL